MMQNLKNPLIYVIDHNHIFSNLVVSFLKTNHLTRVEVFSSGENALKKIPMKPDVIVLDHLFEGMNGLEFLVKAKKIHPHSVFIFLTGNESVETVVNCMRNGAYDYIVKDKNALEKLVKCIHNIEFKVARDMNKNQFRTGQTLFLIGLAILIIATIIIALKFPHFFRL